MANWVISRELVRRHHAGKQVRQVYYFTGEYDNEVARFSTLANAKIFTKKTEATKAAKQLPEVELVKLT